VLLAFVVLGLVSSVPSQEIGWDERLGTAMQCIRCERTFVSELSLISVLKQRNNNYQQVEKAEQ